MITVVHKKKWREFRESGLLWLINCILHLFGWAIVFEIENEEIKEVYPARVTYRGFDEKSNSEGYIKVSQYLARNARDLEEEARK